MGSYYVKLVFATLVAGVKLRLASFNLRVWCLPLNYLFFNGVNVEGLIEYFSAIQPNKYAVNTAKHRDKSFIKKSTLFQKKS